MGNVVRDLQGDGWEPIGSPPEWLRGKAQEVRNGSPERVGATTTFHGEDHVYCLYIGHGNHGHEYRWFRQLKSEYFETTSEEGTCPNCQEYVARQEGDDYLTCHRCGWQYRPISERLRNLVSI